MGREDIACYRLYAANCVELAQQIRDPDRRVFLFRMAQAWTQLANQAEEHIRAEAHACAAAQPDLPSGQLPSGYSERTTPQPK